MNRTRNAAILFVIGLLFFAVPHGSFASAPRKRVLILFPLENQVPGFIQLESSLRSALTESKAYDLEFYVECMDLTRFPSPHYHDQLMALYREKYSGLKIDLIVAVQTSSLEFLLRYDDKSFVDVPVILYSQDSRLVGKPTWIPHVTAVTGKLDMKGTLALAMRLHPEIQRVFVVTGASQFDQSLKRIAREEFVDFENQVEIQYLSGLPLDELSQRVSSLPKQSLIFYLSVLRDGSGKSFKSPEALALISERANAPIYSVSETYIGSGIVGGHLIEHAAQGAMVAEVAGRILAGEKTESTWSPKEAGNRYIFDARQLKRWGIDEENLPAGSEVRYSDFSIWGAYRWRIVGVISLLVFQAILISALFTNLAKRRRAEQELRKAADEWQATFDSSSDLIMLLDTKFRITRANAAVASYLGLPPDRIVGLRCCSVMYGATVPLDDCVCAKVLETKEHEETVLYDENTDTWLFVSTDPILNNRQEIVGFVHTAKDVTERKRALEAIEASEEFNRAILASLRNHVAILDKNGNILQVNEAWKEFARQNGADSLDGLGSGANYLDVCRRSLQAPDNLAAQALDGIQSVLEGRVESFSLEYPCDSPSEARWFLMKVMPFRNPGGGVVISHTNITERKNAEFEARLRSEELTHVTRIVTVGELATSLAHEINQPLTAIRCNAEAAQRFLAGATPDLDEIRSILNDIVQDDDRAGEVIKRIRALVKKDSPRREKVDLRRVIRDTIALVRSASFLEGLSIMAELDPELPFVQADRVQLEQVLLNLLVNASAAVGEMPPTARKVVVRASLQNGGAVMVSVEDSGPGIAKDILNRVFEPFFTTKADGLGMGLSISRTIIKAHRGAIEAENNHEGGATVRFTLPANHRGHS